MAIQIQYRRGSASEWASANTLLAVGEAGYETDTGRFKVGDGTTNWSNLPYATVKARTKTATSVVSPLTWDSGINDAYVITAQAANLTFNADSSTSPADGQRFVFRIKDNGTSRTLTFTTGTSKSFRQMGVNFPTATTAGKTLYLGLIYNAADSRWDLVAKNQEA